MTTYARSSTYATRLAVVSALREADNAMSAVTAMNARAIASARPTRASIGEFVWIPMPMSRILSPIVPVAYSPHPIARRTDVVRFHPTQRSAHTLPNALLEFRLLLYCRLERLSQEARSMVHYRRTRNSKFHFSSGVCPFAS